MMDTSHMDEAEKSSPETGSDSSMSPCSSDNNDIFGDPLIHPRVGDEYQVEIPSMLSKSEFLPLMKNSAGSVDIVDSSHSFGCGLPIPVTSLRNQANLIKTVKLENPNLVTIENSLRMKVKTPDQTTVGNGYCLVPDQPTEPWSDFEADCFLLGLYLLGKNLLQVARFVETKGMGQILAYYYGQFYASAGYRRWSESRKLKNKKCVVGHRFFSGYRQLELFSRLFPRLSEESKIKLSEASKAFTEGSSSLDEYVFTLKAMVGVHALVDAVGIEKGKEDLTTLIIDSSKNNHVFSQRPEMPSLKACSALTCAEITNYLTGDFRLSKARSNDLFWEAVWPRLLARGWHSEQPLCNGYKGSNHLVFLMPGIKKFSRRKLSKGDHYFDSVSDVLAKIASEPELLQLEDDEANSSSSKVKSDDDRDSSDHERHCYLKPRVSSGFSDLTKFTIVDTSMANEDNPYKVTELRSLPVEAERCFPVSSQIKKAETKSQVNADVRPNGLLDSTLFDHLRESTIDFGSQRILNGNHNPMNHKPRTIKHQFSRRLKHGLSLSSCEGTVKKRRRLSSCVDTDLTFVLALPARNKNATVRIVGPKLSQTDVKLASENVLVPENNAGKCVQDSLNLNHVGLAVSRENEKVSVAREAIDRNLSQKHGKVKTTDVEKTEHFDPEKQKHRDVDEQKCSDFGILTTSNVKKPKHILKEKRKISEATVGHDHMEPQVSFASQETSKAVSDSDQRPERQFVARKKKISGDIDGPSENKEARMNSAPQRPSNLVLNPDQQPEKHFVAPKQEICEDTVRPSDKTEPSNTVLDSDQQPERHFVVEKQEICGDTVGPSDNAEPRVSSASEEPSSKAMNPDQQSRRQSTRSRPLTTKALEALELGFLNPVRQYRKRTPSVAQDQKPKRSRQPRNKSDVFPHDMIPEVKDTCDVNL
ncbi:hypothetical protein RND81_04G205800 [Saponaria officinalis]